MIVKVNIINMPSPKHSGRQARTQLGVLHSAECPLARGYAISLTQWSIESTVEASWTDFVGPGVVVRSVHTDYAAWHASVANPVSWGILTASTMLHPVMNVPGPPLYGNIRGFEIGFQGDLT